MWSLLTFPRAALVLGTALIFSIVAGAGGSGVKGHGQSTAGSGTPQIPMRLVSGAEYASKTSYSLGAGYSIVSTTDHCLELMWRFTSGPETAPYGSTATTGSTTTTTTTGTTSGTTTGAMSVGLVAGVPPGTSATGTTSTGSTSTTTGSTTTTTTGGSPGCSAYADHTATTWHYVYVDGATGGSVGFGINPGTTFGTTEGSTPSLMNLDGAFQLACRFDPGTNMPIEWHSTGNLVGGSFKFHSVVITQTYGSNDNMTWYPCGYTLIDSPLLVTIAKQNCSVSALDSRVAFADADTIPTDANSSGRNLNFNGNIYKGGAFVGNMGPTNSQSDRSGTARVQVYPGMGTNAMAGYSMVIMSMLHGGDPTYADGDLPVGAYCPSTTDPNLPGATGAATLANVNWGTKWASINPGSVKGFDYTQNPLSVSNLLGNGSTNTGSAFSDYSSYVLTEVYDQAYTSGGTTFYSTLALTPITAGQGICLAATGEAGLATAGTSLFHWLFNQNFPTTGVAFPYSDAQPRLWLITGTNIS